ncbi:MAG: efflux RND transporter periplasmic adaptor subunit [Planctomycetota bacterium]
MATDPQRQMSRGGSVLSTLLYVLGVLLVLGGGAVAAAYLLRTGPKATRRQRERRALLVTVREVSRSTERAVVHAMGAVAAAKTVELQPRVSGEVMALSEELIPGGYLAKGDMVVRIDEADYRLAVEQQETEIQRLAATIQQKWAEVAQRESEIAKAQSAIEQSEATIAQREADIVQADAALRIEQGKQAIAQREYELLGQEVAERDRDLVLRQPQLQQAEAACKAARAAKDAAEAARKSAQAAKASAEAMKRSAEAAAESAEATKAAAEVALRKAKLDLRRTTLAAPFNAVVLAESVDLGSQVSPTSRVATLAGTDEFWVEVSVPVDQLQWIRVPRSRDEEGAAVRIYNEAAWGSGICRQGRVLRLQSQLEPQGRMARLLVSVPDPLGLEDATGRTPALLVGSYVRVEIDGSQLEDVIPLPRSMVREGNRVWVMTQDNTLDIRPVDIAFRSRERLLVTGGLEPGERLVTTELTAPVDGMPLRTRADDKPATSEPASKPPEPRPTKGGGA